MAKKLFLIFVFNICCYHAFANFDFNSNCQQAYQNILSLRLKRARTLIDQEKGIHPANSITLLLDNYYDYFWLITTENKADFDRLKENKNKRIDLLEREDDSSPYYNFAIAQVNLQWALIHSRFGENTSAGLEINKAYKLLKANEKKFPAFLPDDIPLGLVNVLLGSLPEGTLKSTLNFFGINGDTSAGINRLQQLTVKLPHSGYAVYYDELVFYLTYVQSYILTDANAYPKMLQYTALMDNNSLIKTYIKSFVALRTGHSTEAIEYLEHKPAGTDYQPYPYLDYLLGIAKMNRLDPDANENFKKFLAENKGVSYIKDACLHLAWAALLEGDESRYQTFVQQVKSKGYDYNEKDKQALTEAAGPAPNPELLKARLLFDGGYYAKALKILDDKNITGFSQHDKTEYYYRLGRVSEALNKYEDALHFYQLTIAAGKGTPYYFGPTAALRTGGIYEQLKNKVEATRYYNMAIAFKNHQYENSIEQKAKAGLKRLGY